MTRLVENFYDSDVFNGISNDTMQYTFRFLGNDTLPAGLNAPSIFGFHNPPIDHLLYYDNQSRIIKDSSTEGVVKTFSYSDGFIYINRYNPTITNGSTSRFEENIFDTLTVPSGDVTHFKERNIYPGQPNPTSIFQEEYDISYSTYMNPFYNAKTSPAVGILLYFLLKNYSYFNDYYSNHLHSAIHWQPSFNYTWNTDSLNRVDKGFANYSDYKYSYQFIYK